MTKYDDVNWWHQAATITQCARGVYLVVVDIGDENNPCPAHWACATPAKARRWARAKGNGPIHWVDVNMNPDEFVLGYVLRKHYRARIDGVVEAEQPELFS